jgi:hypothetical protein
MGDGGTMMADKQMQMLQMLGGGGSGGAAGPGSRDPAMLTMMFGPQVAELYRLQGKDQADQANALAQLDLQRQQQKYMQDKLKGEQGDAAVMSLPPPMRALPGFQIGARNGGAVSDADILPYVKYALSTGNTGHDQIASALTAQGFTDPNQNARVIQSVLGSQPTAPASQGPEFDWYKSLTDAMSGNMQPSGLQFRGGF